MQGLHEPAPTTHRQNGMLCQRRHTLGSTCGGIAGGLLKRYHSPPLAPSSRSQQLATRSASPTTTLSPPIHRPTTPTSQPPLSCPDPQWSRRAALLSLPFCVGWLLPGSWGGCGLASAATAEAVAPGRQLRSLGWSVPTEMTVLNDLEDTLKVYWLNYDGDAELFGSLSPGSMLTVRTFQSHAWRFVDASSGAVVAEHVVAYGGKQVVRVVPTTAAMAAGGAGGSGGGGNSSLSYTYTTAAPPPQPALAARGGGGGDSGESTVASAQQQQHHGEEEVLVGRATAASGGPDGDGSSSGVRSGGVTAALFEGFDGLGNDEQQYCLAQLREIKIYPGGGNVLLALPGAEPPLELALAGPEALSLVAATGSLEQRRPSTLGTWTRSLLATGVEVRRVCITRLVDGVYYCRIVLSRPDSSLCSLDATPGDSLSLALQLGRPIYVSNEVARVHQSVLEVFARRRQAVEAAAARGQLDEAAEAEADRQAQDALDSITRGIPSAPKPVRSVELDRRLDA